MENTNATLFAQHSSSSDGFLHEAGWWITLVGPLLLAMLYLFAKRSQIIDFFRPAHKRQSSKHRLDSVHQNVTQNITITRELLGRLEQVNEKLDSISERSSHLHPSSSGNSSPPATPPRDNNSENVPV